MVCAQNEVLLVLVHKRYQSFFHRHNAVQRRSQVIANVVPALKGQKERIVRQFIMLEIDDTLRLQLFLESIPDVEEEFEAVKRTLKIAHQKTQLGKFSQKIRQVIGHQLISKSLLPHESVACLELRQNDDVRKR
jgi:hypothetical protein